MKSCILVLIGLIALASATSELGNKKSLELRNRIIDSSEGMITLSAKDYKYFVDESPRPYDVVVFFTGNSCGMCDEVEEELRKVASLYRDAGAHYPFKDANSMMKAVYFVKVVFDESTRDIFVKYNFRSIPNLLVSPPRILKLRDSEKAEFFKNYMWQISMSDGTLTSQKLLEHVNKKTGRNIAYKESIFNVLIVVAVFGSIFAGGVLLFLKFKNFFINNYLWFFGSMTIYCICMSGIVYNIIHNVPFTNVDRNGNIEWYHSGSRSQFGAEGYLMSVCISLLGILFIGLRVAPKFSKSAGNVLYLILFVLIYLLITWIENIYKKKSGFYNPIFWPPGHYIKGPLSNDQGNNI